MRLKSQSLSKFCISRASPLEIADTNDQGACNRTETRSQCLALQLVSVVRVSSLLYKPYRCRNQPREGRPPPLLVQVVPFVRSMCRIQREVHSFSPEKFGARSASCRMKRDGLGSTDAMSG